MNNLLFNILQLLTKAKEIITQPGSTPFDQVAELFDLLAQASRQVQTFINMFGAQSAPVGANAIPGSGLDGEKCKQDIHDLKKLAESLQAEMNKAAAPAAHGPFTNLLGAISPEMKKFISGVIIQIITQVLTKSGVALALADAGPEAAETAPKGRKASH